MLRSRRPSDGNREGGRGLVVVAVRRGEADAGQVTFGPQHGGQVPG